MPNMPIGYVILEGAPLEVPEAKVISENGKRVIGEGIIQTAEEENRNGRCYLQHDLLREINCARTKELLSTGLIFDLTDILFFGSSLLSSTG